MSAADFTLRPMERRDLEAVHALELAIFPTPWSFNSYKFELERNNASELWVLEAPEGGVAAYAVVWLLVDEAHIANLAVAPAYRQQGLGRRLLHHALARAAKNGMRYATLEVRVGNRAARSLYKSFGFEVVGRRKAYYRDNQEDALTMRLEALDRVLLFQT